MTPRISPRTIVEAFLPRDGEAMLADIYGAANLAGLADQPVRLAVRRLISAGEVVQRGRGRAGTLMLTESGRRRFIRDRRSLALAYAQDAGDAPWDGLWRLLAVSVPERDRSLRDSLRRQLHELGAAAIASGLYLSPHDLVPELTIDASPYLTTATSNDLVVRCHSDPRAVAETWWPAAPIVSGYDIIDDILHRDTEDPSPPDIVRALQLAEALEQAMRADPLLPPELRNGTWPPTEARTAWSNQWNELQDTGKHTLYRGW